MLDTCLFWRTPRLSRITNAKRWPTKTSTTFGRNKGCHVGYHGIDHYFRLVWYFFGWHPRRNLRGGKVLERYHWWRGTGIQAEHCCLWTYNEFRVDCNSWHKLVLSLNPFNLFDVPNSAGINIKESLTVLGWNAALKGEFNYMPTSNIMSYVIREVTGMSPREYASLNLFPSLVGIGQDKFKWQQKIWQGWDLL